MSAIGRLEVRRVLAVRCCYASYPWQFGLLLKCQVGKSLIPLKIWITPFLILEKVFRFVPTWTCKCVRGQLGWWIYPGQGLELTRDLQTPLPVTTWLWGLSLLLSCVLEILKLQSNLAGEPVFGSIRTLYGPILVSTTAYLGAMDRRSTSCHSLGFPIVQEADKSSLQHTFFGAATAGLAKLSHYNLFQ